MHNDDETCLCWSRRTNLRYFVHNHFPSLSVCRFIFPLRRYLLSQFHLLMPSSISYWFLRLLLRFNCQRILSENKVVPNQFSFRCDSSISNDDSREPPRTRINWIKQQSRRWSNRLCLIKAATWEIYEQLVFCKLSLLKVVVNHFTAQHPSNCAIRRRIISNKATTTVAIIMQADCNNFEIHWTW